MALRRRVWSAGKLLFLVGLLVATAFQMVFFVALQAKFTGGEDGLQGTGRDAAVAVPGLVEQLTARELEILALLAAGTPNQRIAEQLVVSLDTVKKHVTHILSKLGAANRTEAVTRARQLGLIP